MSGLSDRSSRPSCFHQTENSPESFWSEIALSVPSGSRNEKIFFTAGSIFSATKTAWSPVSVISELSEKSSPSSFCSSSLLRLPWRKPLYDSRFLVQNSPASAALS